MLLPFCATYLFSAVRCYKQRVEAWYIGLCCHLVLFPDMRSNSSSYLDINWDSMALEEEMGKRGDIRGALRGVGSSPQGVYKSLFWTSPRS